MEGLGAHHFWGASPALDLLEQLDAAAPTAPEADDREINLLLVDPGDIRHVLKTLAGLRREGRPRRKVKIHLFDNTLECHARHLLLLAVLTDWSVPIHRRANTFLEIFGNTQVQEKTEAYIADLGNALVRFVCDEKGSLRRLVDLSQLKYRDVDGIEKILKSWQPSVPFEMGELRDRRLRALYGQRYDGRAGLADWDYQDCVKRSASVVHAKQYRHWRETGIAFEFGDQTYPLPNRSMASYAQGKENGRSRIRRGFWGDVVMSPYFALGVDCEKPNQFARELFQVLNKGTATEQHRHTAVHVAVYNVVAWLHEIETGRPYRMKREHDVYSGLDQRTSEQVDAGLAAQDKGATDHHAFAMECANSILELKDLATVVLLSGDTFESAILTKPRFHNNFDLVWLSNHQAHHLKQPALTKLLRDGDAVVPRPLVIAEAARNLVPLKPEQREQFAERLPELAATAGLHRLAEPAPAAESPNCLLFTAKKI